MKTFNYVIQDEIGIHARPAGGLAKLVKTFNSVVTVSVGDKTAKAKSAMAVMGLGAMKGTEVTFTIEGEDEEAACEAISKYMAENL